MRFYVAVTDNDWFRHLADQPGIEEVNFWHPGSRNPVGSLPEGTPYLFKVKAPYHHIAGGGYFTSYTRLPLPLAWDAFGTANGVSSYREFSERMVRLRRRDDELTPEIGCSILRAPCFWPQEHWIPADPVFSKNIVSGKGFDTRQADHAALWQLIESRLRRCGNPTELVREVDEIPSGYGNPTLVRPRRGQGAFQALVTNAYQRRCAITGESTLPTLEAAHIRPVRFQGVNNTYNGLLLRADFHKLFDRGLVTVTPQHRVVISDRIKHEWFNGKAYYRLQGQELASLPAELTDRPRADLLTWHNENVFEREVDHGQ
ncbi:MAG: HNH endonuclease [Gemmatimonadales bacterium]